MFPILYNKNEINFIHNGLGVLSGAISVLATEELNGLFELSMEYDSEGFLADEIANDMIVKTKANDKQDLQLFRIYSVTKKHDTGNLVVNARHITNDLASNFVESLVLTNRTTRQAMEAIQANLAYPTRFIISSSNETTTSSTKLYRTNPLQMVAGMDGSILDNWGGQIERDNFNLLMHKRRGSDDGVTVAYSKNLTGLTATFDVSNVVTRTFPFAIKDDKLITIQDKYIDSPNIDKYPHIKILPVDYSNDEDITDRASLYKKAKTYFNRGGKDEPEVSMEVQFEPLWHTEEYKDIAALERVGMGDTVTVWHSKMGVHAKATVVKIEYDPISEKNKAVHIGNVKSRLTDSFSDKVNSIVNDVEQAKTSANEAIKSADGKSTIYYGTDEPTNAQIDDVWFKTVDGEYTRTYRFDGIQWQVVLSMDAEEARNTANEARKKANEAVANANIATENAQSALNDAQSAFDKAQLAITSADSAFNKANDAFGNVTALSTVVDDNTGEISTVKQSVKGLQTQVSDHEGNISTLTQIADGLQSKVTDAEGNISTLQQTSKLFATRIADTEGNVSSLTQISNGLQSQVSDIDGNVTTLTQLSNAMQARLTDAEGNINKLTLTSQSLQSTISGVRSDLDNLQVGGRNYVFISKVLSHTPYNTQWTYDENTKTFTSTVKIVNQWTLKVDGFTPSEGETYTLSGYMYIDGEPIGDDVFRTDKYFNTYQTTKSITVNPDTGKFTVTMFYNRRSSWIIHAYKSVYVREGAQIELKELQFEKGNKATDWTPAPEDQEAYAKHIAELESKLAREKAIAHADNVVTAEEQARINDVKNKLEQAKNHANGLHQETTSQITQLRDNINLRVKKGDIINQINISDESILIDAQKIHITGSTKIDDASITSAKIKSLDAGKITAGTLDAGRVNVINLSANSIRSGLLASQNDRVTFDLNKGLLNIKRGAITIERPDGAPFILNGIPQFEFAISPSEPPYRGMVEEYGVAWLQTTKTSNQATNYYSFKHQGRYLKLYVLAGLSKASYGSGAVAVEFVRDSHYNETIIVTNANSDFNANNYTITVDLGIPDYSVKSFYLMIRTGRSDNPMRIRKLRIWQEG